MAATGLAPMPKSIDNAGYVVGSEFFDSILIGLATLTEAGSYFDNGFESIDFFEIAKGGLFLLGYAMNIYLISYNSVFWWWVNYDRSTINRPSSFDEDYAEATRTYSNSF